MLALLALVGIGGTGTAAVVERVLHAPPSVPDPWFAPYLDVTLPPQYRFEDPTENVAADVVLGFVVSDPGADCVPSWGGHANLDDAAVEFDVDRRIARLRGAGGDVVVSFGGLSNRELALDCSDEDRLVDAYREVVDRYGVTVVDFDIEGDALSDIDSIRRRARAVKVVQDEAHDNGTGLAVWLTVPVAPPGMTPESLALIDEMLGAGVDLAGVNVMTMNFASSREGSQDMIAATEAAAKSTHRQLDGAYRRAGIPLSGEQVWAKIGLTPMIGQNDVPTDRLHIDDAPRLLEMVKRYSMGRLSMWSLNRDRPCGSNVDGSVVNNNCSGEPQEKLEFSQVFSALSGRAGSGALAKTVALGEGDLTDDPATSPYPIWRRDKGYLAGNKVVWHRSVYEAKWYTQGFAPDTPVVYDWESPWRIIGPVLPSDRPAPTTTLAPGTYPEWSATEVYEAGERVLHSGWPYEAKWWSQGDVPGADVANPWDSPWRSLAPLPGEEVSAGG